MKERTLKKLQGTKVNTVFKKDINLLTKTGRRNSYRLSFYQGTAASQKDDTYDPAMSKSGGHRCCGSKVKWRHKLSCKKLGGNEKWKALETKEPAP